MNTGQRIDSRKNIAKYVNRDVATCMKWATPKKLSTATQDEIKKALLVE